MPKRADEGFVEVEAAQTLESRIAAKLRALRDKKGLTQYQAADGAKVGRRTYCTWEAGERLPSGRYLAQLAEFYGTTIGKLLA